MSRQKNLREKRTLDPADPSTMVLQTKLGGPARPVPLIDQIRALVRNELIDENSEEAVTDFSDEEEMGEPLTIYEAAAYAAENPDEIDNMMESIRSSILQNSPPASAEEDPAPENLPSADSDAIPPPGDSPG